MKVSKSGWIGCDLDGTIAEDHPAGPFNPLVIGKPIKKMVDRIKEHLEEGYEVRIFTARVAKIDHHTIYSGTADEYVADVTRAIQDWCMEHIGVRLRVTAEKDYQMYFLYDDRARQVERNTGRVIGE